MADSLVNSAMRPLKLRRRADLECRRNHYDGRTYWVVKEPVGLNYFRFHEEEFEILQMLDGTPVFKPSKRHSKPNLRLSGLLFRTCSSSSGCSTEAA